MNKEYLHNSIDLLREFLTCPLKISAVINC